MLVSFEVAKLASDKKFNMQECTSRYFEGKLVTGKSEHIMGIPAPTQSNLQKWIRDKHKLDVLCVPDILGYSLRLYGVSPLYYIKTEGNNIFQTYEECLEEGLKQLLNKLEDE